MSLGTADCAARFSSRALGHASALFGMLVVGAVVFTLWVWASGSPLVWTSAGLWLLAVNGVAVTVAILHLYRGLARGPISIVAPIVASHPALVVALSVAMGSRPDAGQWGALVVTLAGAIVIAGCARRFAGLGLATQRDLRLTVTIAGCSSLAYAVLISAGQVAVPIHGELQTLWVGRVISFAANVLLSRCALSGPGSWRAGGRSWPPRACSTPAASSSTAVTARIPRSRRLPLRRSAP